MRGNMLIVEDEPGTATAMSACLRQSGHAVRIGGSAEEALRLISESRPDVVLLDHELPGMSGIELLRRLKQSDPTIRIVMLTGRGSVDMAVEAMTLGATDFLVKPVDFNRLRIVVAQILGRDAAMAGREAGGAGGGFASRVLRQLSNCGRRVIEGCAEFRDFAAGDDRSPKSSR